MADEGLAAGPQKHRVAQLGQRVQTADQGQVVLQVLAEAYARVHHDAALCRHPGRLGLLGLGGQKIRFTSATTSS